MTVPPPPHPAALFLTGLSSLQPFTSCPPAALLPAPLSSSLLSLFLCSPNTTTCCLFHFPFLSLRLPFLDFSVQPMVDWSTPLALASQGRSLPLSLSLSSALCDSVLLPWLPLLKKPFYSQMLCSKSSCCWRALPPISYTGSLECWSQLLDSW